MDKLVVSGHPISYRKAGKGPPFLLLHGWGGSSRYWKSTLDYLADIRTVYAPDLPGYGESPPLPGTTNPDQMAALMMEFADTLGMETFALNGHSFSAGVTVYMAANHPQRITHLVLTCPSTYRSERERRMVGYIHRMTGLWMSLRRPWMKDKRLLHRVVARPFFYHVPDDDSVLRESFYDFLTMDFDTAFASALNAVPPGYNEALQQVFAPTLVVGGRQDSIMPGYGPPLVARLVQNGTIAWVERCGHLPMVERPDIYNPLLYTFLTDSYVPLGYEPEVNI